MTELLISLRRILDESIDTIVSVCERRNEDFPHLDVPAHPSEFSPQGIRNDPEVAQAIKLGVAAASQLVAALQSPIQAIANLCFLATIPSNIAASERVHVPEIIRNSGDKGMHVTEIVKYNGANVDKLERILRHLATHHIFREVSPRVFAHNMLSSLLDTGKDYKTIIDNPENKYDNTNGLCAFAAMLSDELSKAYPHTADVLADPSIADSQELNETTLQKALNMKHTLWQYLDLPENAFRGRRFNIAMRGISALQPSGTILGLYDWDALPERATIVDVGSGLGHVSLEIAAARPDFRFILEDRPSVVAHAKEYWSQHAPIAMTNAHFLGLDFLHPQPKLPYTPDVFFLRYILHNQPDNYATMLLGHLRKVATEYTKLIIIDFVVEYVCPVPEDSEDAIPGDPSPAAPSPLLTNFGVAGAYPYNMDMVMLSYLNAKERTIGAWRDLLFVSGWKLITVKRDPADRTGWPLIVSEPILSTN
ncbi:O-methyltransferase [Irpex rosettiformis]|uniref:O-methyltransferase n=1 Tax=Irpex rosettiformis TaxID=378272 RepID=A0ACB8TYX3_9APHY|nr:O-methyltransferase [Irpex rosettiformis]